MRKSNIRKRNLLIVLTFMVSIINSFAQSDVKDTTDITTMSLEDLMKNKSQGIPSLMESKIASGVDVASAKPMVLRKSPAILSVITSEDIEHSGARDLMEILNTVPGFDFGVDVSGVTGIGVRGNWAHEGKVLLLLDGQELNENAYGTTQFGGGFPIDHIKRIEIIRGPGSAIYGGAAEYAVINIISKNENEGNGIGLVTTYGTTERKMARNTYSLSAENKIKNFGINFNGFLGTGIRSDQTYTDVYGNSYDMANDSKMNSLNLNFGVNYKNLSIKLLYLNNLTETRDGYEQRSISTFTEYFKTFATEVKYSFKFTEYFSLTPKFSYKRNSPWEITASDTDDPLEADEVTYKTTTERYKLNLTSDCDVTKNLNITFGVEGFLDLANKYGQDVFRNSDKQKVAYQNGAGFAQTIYKNKIINLTVGARYDYNNSFGSAFVPRIGLTKRIKNLNFKLLYSQAFKAPSIENVETSLTEKIKPEKTTVLEFEASYQLSKSMFLTLNVFDVTSKNTIIYDVDTSSTVTGPPDGYVNAEASGSQGLELEYKIAEYWGTVNVGYSFYTRHNKPEVCYYEDPYNKNLSLGFGSNKLSINTTFNITSSVYISPSFIYKSKKTGITGVTDEGDYIYTKLPATYEFNLFLGKDNLFIKNLKASIGVYNIFNDKIQYVQPYASGHAPLPGLSREFLIRLSYSL